jgi:hypothetical protein
MLKVKGLNFEQGYFKVSTLKYHVLKYLQIMVHVTVVNEMIYESTRKIKKEPPLLVHSRLYWYRGVTVLLPGWVIWK